MEVRAIKRAMIKTLIRAAAVVVAGARPASGEQGGRGAGGRAAAEAAAAARAGDAAGAGETSRHAGRRQHPLVNLRPTPSCKAVLASKWHRAWPSAASAAGRRRSATKTCRTSFAVSTLSED